ncbi:hypothetical protein ACHAQJ_004011 [Trichoderma viride]
MAPKNTNRGDQPPAYGEPPQPPQPTALRVSSNKHIINQVRKWVIITSSKDLFLGKANTLGKASIRVATVNTRKANILKVNMLRVNILKATTEDPDSSTLKASVPVELPADSSGA